MTDDVNKSKKPPVNQSSKSSDVNGNQPVGPFTQIVLRQQTALTTPTKKEVAHAAVKEHYTKAVESDLIEQYKDPTKVNNAEIVKIYDKNITQQVGATNELAKAKASRIIDANKRAEKQASAYMSNAHQEGRRRANNTDPTISAAGHTKVNRSDNELHAVGLETKNQIAGLKARATGFINNSKNFDEKGYLTQAARKEAAHLDQQHAGLERKAAINASAVRQKKILGLDENSQDLRATKARQKAEQKRERISESIMQDVNRDKITTRVQGDLKAKLGMGSDSYKSQNQKFFDAQAKAAGAIEKLADKSKLTAEEIEHLETSLGKFTKEMDDAAIAVAAHGKKTNKKDTAEGSGGRLGSAYGTAMSIAPLLMQAVSQITAMVKAGVNSDIEAGAVPIAGRHVASLESRSIQVAEHQLANRKFDQRAAAINGDMTALFAIGDTKWGEKGGLQDILKDQKGADWINRDFDNGAIARGKTKGVAQDAEYVTGEKVNREKIRAINKLGLGNKSGTAGKLPTEREIRSPGVAAPAVFALGDDASNYAKTKNNPDGYTEYKAPVNRVPKKGLGWDIVRGINGVTGAAIDTVMSTNGTNLEWANMKSMEDNKKEFQNSVRAASVKTQNLDLDTQMAQRHISGAMAQQTYQYAIGMREANNAIGGTAANQLLSQYSGDRGDESGLLGTLEKNGISPEQFTAAAAQHGAVQGSVFKSSNILQAKKMENAGYGSMELNLQRQDALAGAGANNPSDDLASIMAMGVEQGLNSSASITAMVSHTAKMAETSGAGKYGLDVTKEAAASIARFVDPNAKNKEQAEEAAADAASIINKQNSSVGTSFQDQIGIAQIMQNGGMTHKSAVQLKMMSDPLAGKLANDLKAIDNEKDETKKQALIKTAEKDAFNLIPNAMGSGEVDVTTAEGRKKILGGLDARSKSIGNTAQNMIENVTADEIKDAGSSYDDIKDKKLRGRIGTVASTHGLSGQAYMNQINGKDVESGDPNKLTTAPKAGSPQATLNDVVNAQNTETAKQARLAAEQFGGVAKTMEAVNMLMKQRLEELNSKNANAVAGAGDDRGRGNGDAFNISDTMKQPLADLQAAAEQAAAALRLVAPNGKNVPSGNTQPKASVGKR